MLDIKALVMSENPQVLILDLKNLTQ